MDKAILKYLQAILLMVEFLDQLRLVIEIPLFFTVSYIPGGDRRISAINYVVKSKAWSLNSESPKNHPWKNGESVLTHKSTTLLVHGFILWNYIWIYGDFSHGFPHEATNSSVQPSTIPTKARNRAPRTKDRAASCGQLTDLDNKHLFSKHTWRVVKQT